MFVLKRDVKLQLTSYHYRRPLASCINLSNVDIENDFNHPCFACKLWAVLPIFRKAEARIFTFGTLIDLGEY